MTTMTLTVTARTEGADAVRAAGSVPGVVYGPKQEAINIAVDAFTFEKTLHEAGESTIITLTGLEEEIEVLVQDVAFNAARGGVEHVDFYAIERGKELTTNVAIDFVGEAPAEKAGHIINKSLQEVEVTCRPSVLPSSIEVDITGLTEVDQSITVGDLVVVEGVAINTDAEISVVSVSAAKEEVEEEVATEAAPAAEEAPAESVE